MKKFKTNMKQHLEDNKVNNKDSNSTTSEQHPRVRAVMQLQRTIGNTATQRLLSQQRVFPKQNEIPQFIQSKMQPESIQTQRDIVSIKTRTPGQTINRKHYFVNSDRVVDAAKRMVHYYEKAEGFEDEADELKKQSDYDQGEYETLREAQKRADSRGFYYYNKMTRLLKVDKGVKGHTTTKIGFSKIFRPAPALREQIRWVTQYYSSMYSGD